MLIQQKKRNDKRVKGSFMNLLCDKIDIKIVRILAQIRPTLGQRLFTSGSEATIASKHKNVVICLAISQKRTKGIKSRFDHAISTTMSVRWCVKSGLFEIKSKNTIRATTKLYLHHIRDDFTF